MKIPLYGCATCGRFGWARPGERIDGAGEEAGVPLVRKEPRGGRAEGEWLGDCGHSVPPDSALARCLNGIPPHGVRPLDANRRVEMDDWKPSATH